LSGNVERDINEIKNRVTGLDNSVDLLLRASRKQITDDLMIFFGRSLDRIKVFLAIDGEKTVGEIAKKIKIDRTNVSRRITELLREDLVYLIENTQKGKVYAMTRKVKILNLQKELKKKFDLD
jgi:DNA-binding MarR family transcriptional regulator